MPVWCERSDRLIAQLLPGCLAGDDEQPVAPSGHQHRWCRHGGILSHCLKASGHIFGFQESEARFLLFPSTRRSPKGSPVTQSANEVTKGNL